MFKLRLFLPSFLVLIGLVWGSLTLPSVAMPNDPAGFVTGTANKGDSLRRLSSPPSLRRLKQDFDRGILSADRYLILGVVRLEKPQHLPERYKPIHGEQFDVMNEAIKLMSVWDEVTPETRRTVRAISDENPTQPAPPMKEAEGSQVPNSDSGGTSCGGISPLQTDNFEFHWSWFTNQAGDFDGVRLPSWSDGSSDDGAVIAGEPNGCPDDVDRLALTMENARHVYEQLGFDTSTTTVTVSIESTPAIGDCGGFVPPYNDDRIEIEPCAFNDSYYLGRHELFHVIQYNYVPGWQMFGQGDDTENGWWMEATAEWAAKQVDAGLPDRDRYKDHLDDFLGAPSDPLITNDFNRSYGAFLFAQTLEERFQAPLVRQTWARMGQPDYPGADQAIRELIINRGTSVESVMTDFWWRTYHMSSDGGSWTDPDEGAWVDELLEDTRTQGDGTYWARPGNDHRYVYEAYPQSNFAPITIRPGGAAFVDLEPGGDVDTGKLTVTVEAADGRGFEESAVELFPFFDHPVPCSAAPVGYGGNQEVTFELMLGQGCGSATLAMMQTTIDAEEDSRLFNWTATFEPVYEDQVLGDDPIGYWRLGEVSGSVAQDSSGNGLHGEYDAGVERGQQGALRDDPDPAIRANGSPGVVIPYDPRFDVSHLAAEAWVRTSINDGFPRGVIHRPGAFYVAIVNGKARAVIAVTNGTTTSILTLDGRTDVYDGRWHHLAVTYDGSTARLYVDGEEDANPKAYSGRVVSAVGNGLLIGKGTSTYPFKGDIDEAAIYDHSVSQARLAERFSHRWSPTPVCQETTAYTGTICAANPIGYWRLGEQSGTNAADYTSLQNGSFEPGVTLGRPGALGEPNTAIGTSGAANSFVNIPYEPYGTYATRKLTAEAWMRTSIHDGIARGVIHRPGAFYVAIVNGKGRAVVAVSNGTTTSNLVLEGNTGINDGRWHHLAVTFDGSTARLYVDGEEDAPSKNYSGRLLPAYGNGFMFGKGTTTSPFEGEIDEVAVYDHALSEAQMSQRFAHGRAPEAVCTGDTPYTTIICAANPIGYWRLGEQSGTNAADYTSLQNGSFEPGVTLGRPGALGEPNTAIGTSGAANSFVNIPYHGIYAKMKRLSAEAWVRTSTNDGVPRAVVHRPGAFYIAVENGKVKAGLNITDGNTTQTIWVTSSMTVDDGEWHHLAFTYDGTTARLYLDGMGDGAPSELSGDAVLAIGNGVMIGNGTSTSPFTGDIDEVAIYDHALSAQDISARWTSQ